jgi:UMF1 family MFS transporter
MAAWCAYDWANSAFPTVILTFVFAAYFAKKVAADEVSGTSAWAYAVSLSMAAVALSGPVLGAIADAVGRRKPLLALASGLCIAASAGLWFVAPDPAWVLPALVLMGIANFAFETGIIFYNAMLPGLAPPLMLGRLSGWGWATGYAGGLVCLGLALAVLITPSPPPFGLDPAQAEPVRATALLVALWFALFALPLFAFVPDGGGPSRPPGAAVRHGVATLIGTLRQIRHHRVVARYLVAHMVYTDGLNTLFGIGGIYAAVTFDMGFDELLLFGIAMNVTAGLGAFGFGWVDDRIGPKATVLLALAALTGLGAALSVVEAKPWFWALALPMGIFFGPAQSASRTLMARLAPPRLEAEMFGLYALSGKATAFAGPALFGWVTGATGSQRAGLGVILVLFVAGMMLLALVPAPPSARR